jgi:hypothetical protein
MCAQAGVEIGWDDLFRAVQLSRAGAVVAWSVGDDSALVCTDVTTCQILTSTDPVRHTKQCSSGGFWVSCGGLHHRVPGLKSCNRH